MFRVFKKKKAKGEAEEVKEGIKEDNNELQEKFSAMTGDLKGNYIEFYTYLHKELGSYWEKLYEQLKQRRNEENLDFFLDYLNFAAKPTIAAWKTLYKKWIITNDTEYPPHRYPKINIIGKTKNYLERVDAKINEKVKEGLSDEECEDVILELDQINIEVKEQGAKRVLTVKEIIDSTAREVLALVSNDAGNAEIFKKVFSKNIEEKKTEKKKYQTGERKVKEEKEDKEEKSSSKKSGFGK